MIIALFQLSKEADVLSCGFKITWFYWHCFRMASTGASLNRFGWPRLSVSWLIAIVRDPIACEELRLIKRCVDWARAGVPYKWNCWVACDIRHVTLSVCCAIYTAYFMLQLLIAAVFEFL